MLIFGIEGVKRFYEVLLFLRMCVVVDEDVELFVRRGKNVFVKFVVDVDLNIRFYDEVFVVNRNDEFFVIG